MSGCEANEALSGGDEADVEILPGRRGAGDDAALAMPGPGASGDFQIECLGIEPRPPSWVNPRATRRRALHTNPQGESAVGEIRSCVAGSSRNKSRGHGRLEQAPPQETNPQLP
jgi:hypothetical protein